MASEATWTYCCPMCLSPIPHEVANTQCAPSGTAMVPSKLPLPPDWKLWESASIEAFHLIEREAARADRQQEGDG